jgi:hypothetical protein
MKFYREESTKRIVDNYEFLIKNEYLIDKVVKLNEEKKMDEFLIEYAKMKDIIQLFEMTLKDTELKIKLIHQSKLNVDENELAIFNEYIKEINKNKIKKYMNVKKVGDKLLKKKGSNLPRISEPNHDNDNFNNDKDDDDDDDEEKEDNHNPGKNILNEYKNPYDEMREVLNEREGKIIEIEERAENLRESGRNFRKAATQVANAEKKNNDDCSIF